jgi:hypothetical protein
MLSHLCRSCFRALRRFVDELYVKLEGHGPYSTRDPIARTSYYLWPFHKPASVPVSRIAFGHRISQFDKDAVCRYFWTARSGRCSRIASMRTRSGPIHVTSTRRPRRIACHISPLSGRLMNRVSEPSQRVSSDPSECSAETQKDIS